MKTPSITIITPTFNRRQALVRAIDSVRGQSVDDYEHIIVDDGSVDATGEMVAGYADERIRYYALPQRSGANVARNLAIEKARSPVLTFLDSDDEYEPFRLQHALSTLRANPHVPLMLSSFVVNRQQGPLAAINLSSVVEGDRFEQALAWRLVHIAGTSITVRRDAIERIRGFNTRLRRMQDRDVLLRLAQTGPVVLSDQIDWVKHNSPDAITLGTDVGGVEAFGDLVESSDCYRSRHREAVPFFVAVRILREIRKFRWGMAFRAYNENLAAPALGFSAGQLIRSYSKGKRLLADSGADWNLMAPDPLPVRSGPGAAPVGKEHEK